MANIDVTEQNNIMIETLLHFRTKPSERKEKCNYLVNKTINAKIV